MDTLGIATGVAPGVTVTGTSARATRGAFGVVDSTKNPSARMKTVCRPAGTLARANRPLASVVVSSTPSGVTMATSASAIGADVPETITVPATDPPGAGAWNSNAAIGKKSLIVASASWSQ